MAFTVAWRQSAHNAISTKSDGHSKCRNVAVDLIAHSTCMCSDRTLIVFAAYSMVARPASLMAPAHKQSRLSHRLAICCVADVQFRLSCCQFILCTVSAVRCLPWQTCAAANVCQKLAAGAAHIAVIAMIVDAAVSTAAAVTAAFRRRPASQQTASLPQVVPGLRGRVLQHVWRAEGAAACISAQDTSAALMV